MAVIFNGVERVGNVLKARSDSCVGKHDEVGKTAEPIPVGKCVFYFRWEYRWEISGRNVLGSNKLREADFSYSLHSVLLLFCIYGLIWIFLPVTSSLKFQTFQIRYWYYKQ